jgi:hypothetical protein
MKNKIYIGPLIEKKMKERGISIVKFAAAVHCSRANIYSIFKRKSIDPDRLHLISEVLEYDFFELYNNNPKDKFQNTHMVIAEVPENKFQELLSDDSIHIIKSWEVSRK